MSVYAHARWSERLRHAGFRVIEDGSDAIREAMTLRARHDVVDRVLAIWGMPVYRAVPIVDGEPVIRRLPVSRLSRAVKEPHDD